MNKRILLSTFNFSKTDGIKDYIKYFKNLFGKNIKISNKLSPQYDVIVLIDDFHNNKDLDIYKRFKKENPNVKFVLVFTEFINRKLKTFNNFDFEKDFYDFIIILMNSYYNLVNKKIFNIKFNYKRIYVNKFFTFLKILKKLILFKFNIISSRHQKNDKVIRSISIQVTTTSKTKENNNTSHFYKYLFLIFSLIYSFFKIKKNKYLFLKKLLIFYRNKSLKQKLINTYYFQVRYNNLRNILHTFDLILCSHPGIENNLRFYSKKKSFNKKIHTIKFYPKKKITYKNKEIIYFSGEYTEFRKKFFNGLIQNNKSNQSLYSKYTKNLYLDNYYTVHENNHKYLYSLNPIKEKSWPYSSPTRYLRSISRNEIPIVFNYFKDYTDKFTLYIDPKKFDIDDLINNYKKYQIAFNKKLNVISKLKNVHIKNLIYKV